MKTTPELELVYKLLARCPDLTYSLGEFWRFQAGQWRELPPDLLHAELVAVFETSGLAPLIASYRLFRHIPNLIRAKLAIPPERWNTHPGLLPCRNGVLDLATSQLHPPDPQLYLLRT